MIDPVLTAVVLSSTHAGHRHPDPEERGAARDVCRRVRRRRVLPVAELGIDHRAVVGGTTRPAPCVSTMCCSDCRTRAHSAASGSRCSSCSCSSCSATRSALTLSSVQSWREPESRFPRNETRRRGRDAPWSSASRFPGSSGTSPSHRRSPPPHGSRRRSARVGVMLMDHWFQMESFGGPPEPMLEGYTTLGYLAGVTERVRLSLLVTGVTYRHPGLLAKIVTTLDVLSGGRAMLGIGAAWYEREHLALGRAVPADLRAVRAARGDAADRAARCGATTTAPYEGKHYQLAETVCVAAAAAAAAPADHDRRRRRAEDAAARRAVRRRVQPLRRHAGRGRATSSTCCAGTATPTAATTTRSRRRSSPGTVRAGRRRRPRSSRHGGLRRARDRHHHPRHDDRSAPVP